MNKQKKKQGGNEMTEDILQIAGKRIKEARKAQGLTQQKLGDAIGVSRQRIGQYEKGERTLKIHYFGEIAKILNVSTDYLLGLTDVASTDKDTIGVCKYIGISEKPIKTLKNFSKKHGAWRTEKLLESLFGAFEEILNG